MGLQYQYTFYREKNIHVGIMIRAGTVDQQFFAYVPSLMFDYIFNDYLKMNVSVSVRGQLPAIGFHVYVNLPFKKDEFPNPIF